MSHGRRVVAALALAALYGALFVAGTWPLLRAPASTVLDTASLYGDRDFIQRDTNLSLWVLSWTSHALLHAPWDVFHGNAFYPFGNTLSFAEPLLVPALVAGPIHAWTGSPILAYNLTLLLFWALSGWAMYWVAWRVTRCHPAAFVAAVIFTFAPYRTDHYMEFQMEMAFGIPELIVYISGIMTLEPGDLIATGTPEGVGPLKAGDEVEVEIVGLSRVRNPVVGP